MDDTKTITLRKPVEVGGVVYDKLDLREPTAGELEKSSTATSNMGVAINLIALVAKVPRKAAEGLCQRDLKEAGDFFDRFSMTEATPDENSSPT